MNSEIILRPATPADAPALLAIYAPYVEETAITFEYEVPSVEEFRSRIRRTLEKYPYIVAQRGEAILGYAYTGVFKGRAAYDWAVETTIYLDRTQRRTGLGRRLYQALEDISRAQHICNLYACIGYPEVEDEYLTQNSVRFHDHLGYTLVGRFRKCGYKFGTWYDMVWMEKLLCTHPDRPQPIIPFPALAPDTLRGLGVQISTTTPAVLAP